MVGQLSPNSFVSPITSEVRRSVNGYIHSLPQKLAGFFGDLPWASIVLFIFALILAVGIIYLTIRGLKRAEQKAVEDATIIDSGQDPIAIDKLPLIGGWFTEYLARNGWLQVSSLSLSFLRALQFLKKTLNNYNYKYQMPWYLLVGAEGSGKTTLMANSEFNYPFGHQDFDISHGHPHCSWQFLDQAIVLDIRGDMAIKRQSLNSSELGWKALLKLLARYRPAQPLNGIILTIPADELYGRGRLSVDDISGRADYLAQKLNQAQTGLGIRLPVYVLITKTDMVPGFQSFCAEIPTNNRHDILGWSSPYSVDVSYSSSWVDDAFTSIKENLYKLRLELFAEGCSNLSRDGVFVFPSELMTVKENLAIYLNHIFKNNYYQQSLLFRGLYFCGDSGLQSLPIIGGEDGSESMATVTMPEDLIATKQDITNPDVASGFGLQLMAQPKYTPKIFFSRNLFSDKALKEPGLATAQKNKILTINKVLNVCKVMTASFVLLGSYGLYNAYDKFKQGRDSLMPVLGKMNDLLYDLRNLHVNQSDKKADETFDLYARELIAMMDQMQNASFFSVFVPPSWFSPLKKDLSNTLQIAYQQVIVKTIYIDLLIKARDLLHLKPDPERDVSKNMAELLDPLKTPEYLLFKSYVEGMDTLQEKIRKFNALKDSASFNDLNELVQYSFGMPLPENFSEQYYRFQPFLNNKVFPNIDLKPYQHMAKETLATLYQNFLDVVFTTKAKNSLLNRLQELIKTLSHNNYDYLPDINVLRKFGVEIAKAMPSLGEVGKTWMDAEFFSPGPEMDELLDRIDKSELFGKQITQDFVDATAVYFNDFKDYLRQFNALLITEGTLSLVDASGNNAAMDKAAATQGKADGKGKGDPDENTGYKYSEGIFVLANSLGKLFAEPYMATPTGKKLVTSIQKGKIIYWDSQLISAAYELCKRFEEFSNKEIARFPVALQENLRLLAQNSLQANVIDLVARGQSLGDIPTGTGGGVTAEEVLRSKINDLKEVAPRFTKLLEILNRGGFGTSFVELRNLLNATSYFLLSQIETMLENLAPYQVSDFSFQWWDGKPGAALVGYMSQDAADLKAYLQLQYQQILNMVNNYARPLIDFLSSPAMAEAEGDQRLFYKWKRIIEQLDAYDKRQAGNSISVLEDFITKDLNTYDVKNALKNINPQSLQGQASDYFLTIVYNLKRGILSQAEVLTRQQNIENYNQLVDLFNNTLRNCFPFVAGNAVQSRGGKEAAPNDIREFFDKYDAVGGDPEVILDQIYQLGEDAKQALMFLKRMQEVKEFLKGYLNGETDEPAFDVNVDFRTNRGQEMNANMIVDLSFSPDQDSSVNRSDKVKTARWSFGNPVAFSFRWANGRIPLIPVNNRSQSNLSVNERTVIIDFEGAWALLKMLRLQDAQIKAADPTQNVCKFTIPLASLNRTEDGMFDGGFQTNGAPGSKSVVFNAITLLQPSSKPKVPSKPVKVPLFPNFAPELGRGVMEASNKPVLTEEAAPQPRFDSDENKNMGNGTGDNTGGDGAGNNGGGNNAGGNTGGGNPTGGGQN